MKQGSHSRKREGESVSKNMRPFVSRVVRDGAVQKAFANQIGKPVGGCAASIVRAGMSGKVVHGIAKLCSRQAVGTHLNLGGLGRSAGRSSQATEYYEIRIVREQPLQHYPLLFSTSISQTFILVFNECFFLDFFQKLTLTSCK
jgi:hypothetical protein